MIFLLLFVGGCVCVFYMLFLVPHTAAFLANTVYEPDGGAMAAKEVFAGGPLADYKLTKFVRSVVVVG